MRRLFVTNLTYGRLGAVVALVALVSFSLAYSASGSSGIVAQGKFDGWWYVAGWDTATSIDAYVYYEDRTEEQLEHYAQVNRALAHQLAAEEIRDLKAIVVFRRPLSADQLRAWAGRVPIQVTAYNWEAVEKDNRFGTAGGGPSNGELFSESDMKDFWVRMPPMGTKGLCGVTVAYGEVASSDYDQVANDPNVFIIDVTESAVLADIHRKVPKIDISRILVIVPPAQGIQNYEYERIHAANTGTIPSGGPGALGPRGPASAADLAAWCPEPLDGPLNTSLNEARQMAPTPTSSVRPLGVDRPYGHATVSLDPSKASVRSGESFTVDVRVDADVATRGAQVGLRFDPTKVRCDGWSEGPYFRDWAEKNGASTLVMPSPVIDNEAGTVSVTGVAIMGQVPGGVTGSGTFITFRFTRLDGGGSASQVGAVSPLETMRMVEPMVGTEKFVGAELTLKDGTWEGETTSR